MVHRENEPETERDRGEAVSLGVSGWYIERNGRGTERDRGEAVSRGWSLPFRPNPRRRSPSLSPRVSLYPVTLLSLVGLNIQPKGNRYPLRSLYRGTVSGWYIEGNEPETEGDGEERDGLPRGLRPVLRSVTLLSPCRYIDTTERE